MFVIFIFFVLPSILYSIAPQTTTTVLYYSRFTGLYFLPYDNETANPNECDSQGNCTVSIIGYSAWNTTSLAYNISSDLISMCQNYPVFGAFNFGGNDVISLSFLNVPTHTGLIVQFDLFKLDNWQEEFFFLSVDGNFIYSVNFDGDWGQNLCGSSEYNDFIVPVWVSINHTADSFVIAFESELNMTALDKSYAIANLNIFLVKACDPNCLTCSTTTPSVCLTCHDFASMDNTTSLCSCNIGFYLETSVYSRCARCDESCETCSGPASNQCLSCFPGWSFNTSFSNCTSPINMIQYPLEFPNSGFNISDLLSSWTVEKANGKQFISSSCGEYTLVGGFLNFANGAYLTKNFTGLDLPHYSVVVSFDLYFIDAWNSTDTFFLTVDSTQKNLTVDSEGLLLIGNLCGAWNFEYFLHVLANFPQFDNSVTIRLESNLNLEAWISSWGFNNFRVSYMICFPSCLSCSDSGTTDCLSCYNNASLKSDGHCECLDGFVMNNFSEPCTQNPCSSCCHQYCQQCDVWGNCSGCMEGYLLVDNACLLICREGCTNCEGSSTNCSSCDEGYFLTGTYCEIYCPLGTFEDVDLRTCQECDTSCMGCVDSGPQNCDSCFNNSFLLNGECILCNTTCLACEGEANICTSCISNLVVFEGSCLSECPTGYFVENGVCYRCDPECLECVNLLSCTGCSDGKLLYVGKCLDCQNICETCFLNVDNCTSCNPGTFLFENKCLEICPDGYWNSISGNSCEPCNVLCRTCNGSGASQCLDCFSGFVIMGTQCKACINCETCINDQLTCVSCNDGTYIYEQKCVVICPENYYADDTLRACVICDTSCLNCSGPNETNCTVCYSGFFLEEAQCLACYSNCLTCKTYPSFCLTCQSPLFLFDNQCVSVCPDGYYHNFISETCEVCSSNCLTCSSLTTCLSCYTGLFLSNGVCVVCPLGCSSCLNASLCFYCNATYYLFNNICYINCNPGYWMDMDTNVCKSCDPSCVACSGPYNFDCTQCKVNQVIVDGVCWNCDSSCLTCQGIGSFDCLSCPSPYFLQDNTCVQSCGNSYYLVGNTCLRCSYTCNQCTTYGESFCTSCNSTQYFWLRDPRKQTGSCYITCPTPLFNDMIGYQCISGCPLGTFFNSVTSSCDNCDSTCLTCDGETSVNCISCSYNLFLLSNQCLSQCPDGYFPELINAGINGVCEKCPQNCTRCTSLTQCLICESGFYVSLASLNCIDCLGEGYFINGAYCGNCSYGCSYCKSEDNCTTCYPNFYSEDYTCIERTHIQPNLIRHENITLLYYLTFNDTWSMLFNNVTQNKSTYIVKIEGLSVKNYKYVLTEDKFLENTWDLLLNLTTTIPSGYHFTLQFYPPTEDLYNLSPDSLSILLDPYTYCGYLRIYNGSACTNISVVTPSLSLEGGENVLLHFSEDFEDFFSIFYNVTNFFFENIPKSNYNSTIKTSESKLDYHISLSFNQSLLGNPVLIVVFSLPGYLILDNSQRLIPTTLSIVMNPFFMISPETIKLQNFQQKLDNSTQNVLLPLAMISSLLGFSNLGCLGLLSIQKIKYLRYLNVNYPSNALSVFSTIMGNQTIFGDFLQISNEIENASLPSKMIYYGVKLNFLMSMQTDISLIFALLALGVMVNMMIKKNSENQVLIFLRTLFYLNAALIAFQSCFIDLVFYCLVNIGWHSFKTSKGTINFLLPMITFLIIISVLFTLRKTLKMYCISWPTSNSEKEDEFQKLNLEKSMVETKKTGVENTDIMMSLKSPTIITELSTLDRKKTVSVSKRALKDSNSDNYSLIAKRTVTKKHWWDSNEKEMNETQSSIISFKKAKKYVNFKPNTETLYFDPYLSVSPEAKEDWSFIVVLTHDYKYHTQTERLFVLYSLGRDLFYVMFIVLFADDAYSALWALTVLNLFFFFFFLVVRPFKNTNNFIAFFGLEVCVGISILTALVIVIADQTNTYDDNERLDKGWIIFYGYLVSLSIVMINIGYVIVVEVIRGIKKIVKYRKKMNQVVPNSLVSK